MNKLTLVGTLALAASSAFALDVTAVKDLTVTATGDATAQFAAGELVRLLGRAGQKAALRAEKGDFNAVSIGAASRPDLAGIAHDGFVKAADETGVTIASMSGKGVLNGVYALAEEMGFAFLMPGEKGERVPTALKEIEEETRTVNPRFAHRGIFASSRCETYSLEDWYGFLAKLRFNAICAHSDMIVPDRMDLLKLLGFRVEAGGHGMSACLPRDLFEKEPELFRMFQPEDFGGKRMKDSNFCVTNPKTRDIVKENFKKRVAPAVEAGLHAVHAWADDLPGGGWCMCSRCRSLAGTDQSALTMNVEAQAVRELKSALRVPVIAYHDTMFPSTFFAPDPACFLLFAPRERCYAHALNDPSCARNGIYLQALKAYQRRFAGVDDAHTFEYYNDKLLFRGHTPYLPQVVIGDADAYEDGGIACWMSLQVGGDLQAIDWNMLAHAYVAWTRGLGEEELTHRLALAAGGDAPAAWEAYLAGNAAAYATAWQTCDLPYEIYLDYRFMPERGGAEGAALVDNLAFGAAAFRKAVDGLARAKVGGASAEFARLEVKRGRFEALDFDAMVLHQRGLRAIAEYLIGGSETDRAAALAELRLADAKLTEALAAFKADYSEAKGQYYVGFVNNWTQPEIRNKIRVYEAK